MNITSFVPYVVQKSINTFSFVPYVVQKSINTFSFVPYVVQKISFPSEQSPLPIFLLFVH